ncbi:unnamed protein product [Lactuca virosa]|uniref:Uncharacterized protein n=1 Tax=Lactuca virosa TaxID=75947 RepID=A0AAU9MA39_9ASTR|nr:unnamed protein product [Lactuca virosa]
MQSSGASWTAAGLSSGHCRLLDIRSENLINSWQAHDGYVTKEFGITSNSIHKATVMVYLVFLYGDKMLFQYPEPRLDFLPYLNSCDRLRHLGILHDAVPHHVDRGGHPMHVKILLMCIVSSKVARDVVKVGNKFL